MTGWMRLWVLLGALYACVVGFFVHNAWPVSPIRPYLDYSPEWTFVWGGTFPPTERQKEDIYNRTHRPDGADEWVDIGEEVQVLSVDMKDGTVVWFPFATGQSDINEALRLARDPWPDRWALLSSGALWWGLPLVFLLAFGHGVAWVRRGFRGVA